MAAAARDRRQRSVLNNGSLLFNHADATSASVDQLAPAV